MSWAAVIVGGSVLVGGYIQSQSAKSATQAQVQAAETATQAQLEMYYQSREDMAPWREAGEAALGQASTPGGGVPPAREDFAFNAAEYLQMYPDVADPARWGGTPQQHYAQHGLAEGRYPSLSAKEEIEGWTGEPTEGTGLVGMIEAGPGEFVPEEQPGYRFGYEEFVEKPTLRMASATGRLGGGGTQKALTRYASNYATGEYDNWLRRWYDSLKPDQSLAGLGQTSASQTAQNALTTGQMVGQNALYSGTARATGYINQGNIWGNSISGVGQNALNSYMADRMVLFNRPGQQPSPTQQAPYYIS